MLKMEAKNTEALVFRCRFLLECRQVIVEKGFKEACPLKRSKKPSEMPFRHRFWDDFGTFGACDPWFCTDFHQISSDFRGSSWLPGVSACQPARRRPTRAAFGRLERRRRRPRGALVRRGAPGRRAALLGLSGSQADTPPGLKAPGAVGPGVWGVGCRRLARDGVMSEELIDFQQRYWPQALYQALRAVFACEMLARCP